ncbi:MAG: hypothetical protein MUD01_06270 [Chloroflexaceae bacterium]|jgi:hypothetical protein|nr:hypothetical protein [Chloroflexaceae bacterium]
MKTDLPLKRLTRVCPQDILALAGLTGVEVLGVETLELPASKKSLDTVLRLRDASGHEFLHLIEWQGYPDKDFLWRTLWYAAWLGQGRNKVTVRVTVIYLTPGSDMGDTISQDVGEVGGWQVRFSCVRLWQLDAATALASGVPGLVTLSPLMAGATATMVEQAAQLLLSQVAPPAQSELLAALGIFAEPLFEAERFLQLVTRERLMASDLISLLTADMEKEIEALEQERASLLQENTVLHEQLYQRLQLAVEDIVAARFPNAPLLLSRQLRQITDPDRLQNLIHMVAVAPDLAEIERLVSSTAASN